MNKEYKNDYREELSDEKVILGLFTKWTILSSMDKDALNKINEELGGKENISTIKFFSIVQYKLDAVNVKIKINNILKTIFCLCSGGNPGFLQIIVKEFLIKLKKLYNLEEEREISPLDFAYVYPNEFPIVSNNVKEWEKKWDEQKITRDKAIYILGKDEIPPDNKVDTVEYWTELINSIE